MSIQVTQSRPEASIPDQKQFKAYISRIGNVLQHELNIPEYQRPYTWSIKNVRQLISDLQHFRSAGHYRLGTMILHDPADEYAANNRALDIVDGQQRYLTFGLIILALNTRSHQLDASLSKLIVDRMKQVKVPQRQDGKSEVNLRTNYQHLQKIVSAWPLEELRNFTEFFLKECSVVVMEVKDLDAAFQLFDSQNTRGKALYPTDLLKAHHLREFSQNSPSREAVLEAVRRWDALDPEEIEYLFAAVLFPIKRWTTGQPVPDSGFTAAHIDLFKGISQGGQQYRWSHMALMAKALVDQYRSSNATLRQYGVIEELEFPFQLDLPVIDGEMFFRMVDHYISESRRAGIRRSHDDAEGTTPDPRLQSLLSKFVDLPAGTGNRYLREFFDCLLMAYVDRFGWHQVEQAAKKLANRTYALRAVLQRITTKSINKHALGVHHRVDQPGQENLFATIALAQSPDGILTMDDIPVNLDNFKGRNKPFRELFRPVQEDSTP